MAAYATYPYRKKKKTFPQSISTGITIKITRKLNDQKLQERKVSMQIISRRNG